MRAIAAHTTRDVVCVCLRAGHTNGLYKSVRIFSQVNSILTYTLTELN